MGRSEHWLQQLQEARLIGPLDLHFARFLSGAAGACDELVGVAAALTSAARREGHVCLDLKSLDGGELTAESPQAPPLPALEQWRDSLLQSGIVGRPGEWQPLILDDGDRLYLHRYWDHEQRVGRQLLQRAAQRVGEVDEGILRAGLAALFPPEAGEAGVDWQKVAAVSALLQRLSIISGGPGTGKTTTVVRILALLRQQPGGEALRVALAAPTGMAASRLQQSIRSSKAHLSLPAELLAAIPEQAVTLHRLLGVKRTGTGYRHHRNDPLPLDLLILDEASMVDVSLMASLLDALPETARLILLGDRDQLASVEAGAVLGDICHGCEGAGPDFSLRISALSGETLPGHAASSGALGDNVSILRRSYRFGSDSAIGRLARAVNQGDGALAVRLLESAGEGHDLVWSKQDPALLAAERYSRLFDRMAQAAPVQELFGLLREFRLLCALRGGPQGVERMNRSILRHLVRLGRVGLDREWYPGRPVMVTRNDYALGLYNGDLGIVAPHPEQPDQLAVAFPAADERVRWVAPARLSAVETVYAMTVHKSQGSEFDQVVLLLPEQMSPVLCRELIYTAITRSRRQFSLIAPADLFRHAVNRSLSRRSGLVDLLRSGA